MGQHRIFHDFASFAADLAAYRNLYFTMFHHLPIMREIKLFACWSPKVLNTIRFNRETRFLLISSTIRHFRVFRRER